MLNDILHALDTAKEIGLGALGLYLYSKLRTAFDQMSAVMSGFQASQEKRDERLGNHELRIYVLETTTLRKPGLE